MKNILKLPNLYIYISLFFVFSCSDNDDATIIPSATEELVVEDFIWKSMNLWYFWKDSNPNLGDNRFSNNSDYQDFLSSFSSPEELFEEGILVNEDRFSHITSDYNTLFDSQQGIFTTTGIEYGLYRVGEGNDVVGVVQYILPNSDASGKDVQRGDIFYAVNGVSLYSDRENTSDNNLSIIRQETVTLSFADIVDDTIVPNGVEIEFFASEYTENPVHITKVIEEGSNKIGYLMYNGFTSPFDDELNQAIADLKSQGITDLVVDLRYNPGGSVTTSTYLASMITGQFNGSLYSRLRYNDFWQDLFGNSRLSYNFTNQINTQYANEAINSLNLTRVYFITSNRTASASELLINGLEPYIDVIQIGNKTVGKNQASITLLDDPRGDFVSTVPYSGKNREEANPMHTYALQPIVSRTENSAGFSEYEEGLVPDVEIIEDIENLGTLGETSDPLLARTLQEITGVATKGLLKKPEVTAEYVTDSKMQLPTKNNMYID